MHLEPWTCMRCVPMQVFSVQQLLQQHSHLSLHLCCLALSRSIQLPHSSRSRRQGMRHQMMPRQHPAQLRAQSAHLWFQDGSLVQQGAWLTSPRRAGHWCVTMLVSRPVFIRMHSSFLPHSTCLFYLPLHTLSSPTNLALTLLIPSAGGAGDRAFPKACRRGSRRGSRTLSPFPCHDRSF